MKKYIVAAVLSTIALSGVALADTTPVVADSSSTSTTPGSVMSAAQQQIQALRKQMSDEIKAVRAKYQAQIDAIRKAANLSATQLRNQRAKDAADKKGKEMRGRGRKGGVNSTSTIPSAFPR